MQHLLCVSHLSVFLPYAKKIWGGTSIQLLTPMKSIRMYQVDFYLRSCWIGGTSLHQPPGISPISPHGPLVRHDPRWRPLGSCSESLAALGRKVVRCSQTRSRDKKWGQTGKPPGTTNLRQTHTIATIATIPSRKIPKKTKNECPLKKLYLLDDDRRYTSGLFYRVFWPLFKRRHSFLFSGCKF